MVSEVSGFAFGVNSETLVVYGRVGDPKLVLKELLDSGGDITRLTNRYAIISARTDDIRLSSPGWLTLSLDQRLGLQTSDDLFTFCGERLLQNTPPFSGPVRLFLKAYLEFIRAEITSHGKKLSPASRNSDVFTHQDFAFSAWLPFPEARILLPRCFGSDTPEFAETSLAFRANERTIAVLIEGTGTVIPSRQRKLDYLRDNNPQIDIVRVPVEELRSGAFPVNSFPDSFMRFWQGLDLPCGPNPPDIRVVSPK